MNSRTLCRILARRIIVWIFIGSCIGYSTGTCPINGVVVSPINNVTSYVYCSNRYFWSESDGLFTASYEQPVKKLLFRSLWGRVGTLCGDSSVIFWSTDYGYLWKMDTRTDSVVMFDSGRGLITALYASGNEMVYAAIPHNANLEDNDRNGNSVIVKLDCSRHRNDTLAIGLPLVTTLSIVRNKVLMRAVQTTDKLRGIAENMSNSGTIITSRYYVYCLRNRGKVPEMLFETELEPQLITAPDGSSFISVGNRLGSIDTSAKRIKFSDCGLNVVAVDEHFYYGIDTTFNVLKMSRSDLSTAAFSGTCRSPGTFYVCPGVGSVGVFCEKTLTIIPE